MVRWTALASAAAALIVGAVPALAQEKIVLGMPGVPPVFSTVIGYVAEKEGFFKKHGVNVELRQFDSGAAAARAVASGDIDLSFSPTPLVINQIANAGVPFVAIYGFPNPDWAIGTTNLDKAQCQDMAGQNVGIDTPGGARSLALKDMLFGCGLPVNQVTQVALGSNGGAAMIAGQLAYSVLHLDDFPDIEAHGKKVALVTTLSKAVPTSHYLLGVTRRDRLEQKRDQLVRLDASLIEAGRYMSDPKNAEAVAQIATVTGRTPEVALGALKRFLEIGFWAVNDDGMDPEKLKAVAEDQVKVGNIKAGKSPPAYDQYVDRTVWRDALQMTKAQ